ncbi:MAG: outer membrane beta-barrel protein [Ignavibacteria bacterium]
MKTIKFMLVVAFACIAFSTNSQAQMKKKSPYPNFSLSPVGGIAFPIGNFGDNFKSGPSFGLDISYRVNKEVGFYAKFGYNIFASKTVGLSDAKLIEATAGPRYFFTSRNLKSSIFLEAGLGAYNLKVDASPTTLETSETKFGVNAGIGAVLNLSKPIDLVFKVKYHNILTEGGSSSYIAPMLGLDFRFN